MDLTKITNVEVDGIDFKDYPDFVDAHISYAEYNGKEMTEGELDFLSDNSDFVYNQVIKAIF